MADSGNEGSSSASVLLPYVRQQHFEETVFLVLQIVGGHVLLPLLLLVIFLSKRVHRHPVYINFCLSFILSSVLYSLCLYQGRSDPTVLELTPSADLCLIQAAMVNGVQAMTSGTTLALVLHLWIVIRTITSPHLIDDRFWIRSRYFMEIALLIVPFLLMVAFTVVTLVLGSPAVVQDGSVIAPNSALPTVFYCVVISQVTITESNSAQFALERSIYGFSVVMSIITFLIEIIVVYKVLRNIELRHKLPVSLIFRVATFSICRLTATALMFAILVDPGEIFLIAISSEEIFNGIIDLFQATLPLIAFLVLGTQQDVLQAIKFWGPRTADEMHYLNSEDGKHQEVDDPASVV